MIEQKAAGFSLQRKAYGFLIEIYELSFVKDLCFLHKKVEVKIMNKPVEHALNFITLLNVFRANVLPYGSTYRSDLISG